ncbi:MAG: MnhB domain-containing protein [bacterium]|nr:MnhB domain-containing protein [bacterium]
MTPRALIAEIFMVILYPILLGASLWVLYRGHNAPGGGFIGGLMAVAASAAYALVFDTDAALRRMLLKPLTLAACGVLLSLVSGLFAFVQGMPFLSHQWITLAPFGLALPVSTVMLFDLGVYLAVWGAIGGYCLGLIATVEEVL